VRASPSNPNRIPARVLLGQALLSQGQVEDGASQFKAILDLDPNSVSAKQGMSTASRILAARLLERGNPAAAAVQAREAVRFDPGSAPRSVRRQVVPLRIGDKFDVGAEFIVELAIAA